jgi:hypothetical protein
VYLKNASPVIADCRFESCTAAHGGGLGADASSFVMTGCDFEGNTATTSGGGVSLTGAGSASLDDCRFAGNAAVAGGGLAVRNGATPAIGTSLFDANQANQGGAVWYDLFAGGTLDGSTLVFNVALSGMGAGVFVNALATPTVTACIVAFGMTGGAAHSVAGSAPVWGCNCVFGNAGGDGLPGGTNLGTNVLADPQFCNSAGADYTLQATSPCLAVNAPGCGLIGAFDAGGCSAVGVGQSLVSASWGGVKALYR